MKQKQRLLMMVVMGLAPFIHALSQTVTITTSNYTNYLTSSGDEVNRAWKFKNVSDLRTAKKIVMTLPNVVRNISYTNSPSALLANLEELEIKEGHSVRNLIINGTNLKKLTIGNNTDGWITLGLDNSYLTFQDDIILGNNLKLAGIQMKRTAITDLTPIYSKLLQTNPNPSSNAGSFQVNGGKYIRQSRAGVDEGIINPTNQIREIDMSKIPNWLHVFMLRHNMLERIDTRGLSFPIFDEIEINNNLLWSVDFSSVTAAPAAGKSFLVGPQKPVADLTVIKGAAPDGSQDEVRLYLPEGQSELFINNRLVPNSVKMLGNAVATQAIQGSATQKYFKVASVADGTKADLDLYEKHGGFTYQYDTRPNLTDPAEASKRYMDVEVKTYPYIMYINPATKSGKDVNYYSGTLWLDYDAIVPEGTTVWIVTDINKDSVTTGGTAQAASQLNLEKIGDPGDLIPAGTAMYVRSDNKAGLYDFQKAWTHEIVKWEGLVSEAESTTTDTLYYNRILTSEQEAKLAAQRTKIGNRNLLEGYRTATTFDNKYEALILGIESKKGTKMIGFWPFNGTVIPAHRAFISEDTYRRITGDANAKGATFFFNDPETTGIKTVDNEQKTISREGWYTLDGRRLTGKPTQKGIYINNGRKEVVR